MVPDCRGLDFERGDRTIRGGPCLRRPRLGPCLGGSSVRWRDLPGAKGMWACCRK